MNKYINIEHIPCASYGSKKWGDSSKQNKQNSLPSWSLHSCCGRHIMIK